MQTLKLDYTTLYWNHDRNKMIPIVYISTDNIILKNCYLEMLNTESKNWVKWVRDTLFELGFINVWNEQTVNTNLMPIIKQRIFDQAKQSIFAKISVMNKKNCINIFILKCPTYQNFRSKYIKSYYRTRPSVFKLVQLLSTENVKELCNLGKFLINAYKLRENLNSV